MEHKSGGAQVRRHTAAMEGRPAAWSAICVAVTVEVRDGTGAYARRQAVAYVGGDGAEHLLMRLHLTWRGCLADAHAQAYVLLVGINNLLGNMGETHARRSKKVTPAQVAAGS